MDKRILFVVGGSFVYGTEVNMLHCMAGLRDKGWQVHCVVNGWNDGDFVSRLEQEHIPYSVLYLGFFYIRKPLWTLDTLRRLPGALIGFSRILKTFRPHIVFHVTPRTIMTLYPLLREVRTCLRAQEVHPISMMNRILFQTAGRRASKILAVSQSVKRNLVNLGIAEDKIYVVHNGLTFSKRACWNRSDSSDVIRIGVVGRISPLKGQKLVIEAMRLLALEQFELTCIFAGSGEESYVRELKDLAKAYGLDGKIQWRGYIKDPIVVYEDLDILVIPSLTEAFGMVALEGALCGLPVVASRIDGLAEIIENDSTGILFNAGDSGDLAGKIKVLAMNPDLRARLARAGNEHARLHFSQEKMVENTDRELMLLLAR